MKDSGDGVIAFRDMHAAFDENRYPLRITVGQAILRFDGLYQVAVRFSSIDKYNAEVKGSDGLNALECALLYIDGICKNSDEPRIVWDDD